MFQTSNPGMKVKKRHVRGQVLLSRAIKFDLQEPVFLYFAGTRQRERLMRIGPWIKAKS